MAIQSCKIWTQFTSNWSKSSSKSQLNYSVVMTMGILEFFLATGNTKSSLVQLYMSNEIKCLWYHHSHDCNNEKSANMKLSMRRRKLKLHSMMPSYTLPKNSSIASFLSANTRNWSNQAYNVHDPQHIQIWQTNGDISNLLNSPNSKIY